MGHICILCAITREISPLLQRFTPFEKSRSADLPAWRFRAFGNSVTVIQSGIGVNNAAKAASAAAALGPELIISAGFCGALSSETAIGEVFLAEKLYCYSSGALTAATTPDQGFKDLSGTRLKSGTFITTDEIIEKADICRLLPDQTTVHVVEMESAAVAAICRENGIRFIAIRSISDRAGQDPGRLLRQISDNEFHISMAKVAASLIKNPALLAEYAQLYRNTALAGKTLAEGLAETLEHIRW